MRHRVYGKKLNRSSAHRRATLRNLAAALFEHGEIRTTLPKAKAVQPFVERLITLAKRNDFRARRELERRINDRKIHVWVADPDVGEEKKVNDYFDLPDEEDIEFNRYGEVRKAPRLVQHILVNVAPRYADRDGGYTRIVKLAEHRLGDGGDVVLLQLVGEESGPQIGGGESGRRKAIDRRQAFADRLFRGSAATTANEQPADTTAADEPAEDGAAVADPATEAPSSNDEASVEQAGGEEKPSSG